MLIIIGNIADLEANNQNPKLQRSIIWKLIERCKRHHYYIDVTSQLAEAWLAEFTTAENLGEKRIHYVCNNTMATPFKPGEQLPLNAPNIKYPGLADVEFHPSLPRIKVSNGPSEADGDQFAGGYAEAEE